jgi:hypothetical protein
MVKRVDFTDDILDYLRQRRGKLVGPLQMVQDLTKRVKERDKSRLLRGALLSDLSSLIQQEKVIRYRRKHMIKKKGSSAQGLIRISEIFV